MAKRTKGPRYGEPGHKTSYQKLKGRVAESVENMHYMQAAVSLVHAFFMDNGKSLDWLTTENSLLGGVKPVDMAQAGRAKKLALWIAERISENELDG